MHKFFNDEYVVWFKTIKGRLPKYIPTSINENGDVLWISRIAKTRKVSEKKKINVIKIELNREVRRIEKVVKDIKDKVEDIESFVEEEVIEKVNEVVSNVVSKIGGVVKKATKVKKVRRSSNRKGRIIKVMGFARVETYRKYLKEMKELYKEVKGGFWKKYDVEVMNFSFM